MKVATNNIKHGQLLLRAFQHEEILPIEFQSEQTKKVIITLNKDEAKWEKGTKSLPKKDKERSNLLSKINNVKRSVASVVARDHCELSKSVFHTVSSECQKIIISFQKIADETYANLLLLEVQRKVERRMKIITLKRKWLLPSTRRK